MIMINDLYIEDINLKLANQIFNNYKWIKLGVQILVLNFILLMMKKSS